MRSVDELLRTEFGLEDGLADITTWGELQKRKPEIELPKHAKPETPFVQILDFATGTGTFMVQVIETIHKTMTEKWKKSGLREGEIAHNWEEYVPKHLLPRLYGFELMMAPYAIAHMKIGLKLWETGYRFHTEERVRLYLTNTLEEPKVFSQQIEMFAPALAHEAKAANRVKAEVPVTIVIGNPPYAGHSSNASKNPDGSMTFIGDLLQSFYQIDGQRIQERNSKWLQDDYVKFTRWAQWSINRCDVGVCAIITNHSYIDNPTFAGMRQQLLTFFSDIRILNLHGSMKRATSASISLGDENVFDIQQGVGISLLYKTPYERTTGNIVAKASYIDKYGTRESKHAFLLGSNSVSIEWQRLNPTAPSFYLVPRNEVLKPEYDMFVPITSLMPVYNMGVTTGNDDKFVVFKKRDYEGKETKHGKYVPYTYRLFDNRIAYFDPSQFARAREDFMTNMIDIKANIALATLRRPRNDLLRNFFITKGITDKCVISSLDNAHIFPLFIRRQTDLFSAKAETQPNFNSDQLAALLTHVDRGRAITPMDVFAFIYSLFYSTSFTTRYSEFLRSDFAAVPIPATHTLFEALSVCGKRLVSTHLLSTDNSRSAIPALSFLNSPFRDVAKGYPKYELGTVFINPNESGFKGVPDDVWNFHIGGYQVCEKWLKDRRGHTLTDEDIEHYQKIVVALKETIRLMGEIDKVIEEHGGFPGAFVTDPKTIEEAKAKAKTTSPF